MIRLSSQPPGELKSEIPPPQVSEHASWSSGYYGQVIKEALAAAGAPTDLVQIVTGYGEAGNAIVTGGESSGKLGLNSCSGKEEKASEDRVLLPLIGDR